MCIDIKYIVFFFTLVRKFTFILFGPLIYRWLFFLFLRFFDIPYPSYPPINTAVCVYHPSVNTGELFNILTFLNFPTLHFELNFSILFEDRKPTVIHSLKISLIAPVCRKLQQFTNKNKNISWSSSKSRKIKPITKFENSRMSSRYLDASSPNMATWRTFKSIIFPAPAPRLSSHRCHHFGEFLQNSAILKRDRTFEIKFFEFWKRRIV